MLAAALSVDAGMQQGSETDNASWREAVRKTAAVDLNDLKNSSHPRVVAAIRGPTRGSVPPPPRRGLPALVPVVDEVEEAATFGRGARKGEEEAAIAAAREQLERLGYMGPPRRQSRRHPSCQGADGCRTSTEQDALWPRVEVEVARGSGKARRAKGTRMAKASREVVAAVEEEAAKNSQRSCCWWWWCCSWVVGASAAHAGAGRPAAFLWPIAAVEPTYHDQGSVPHFWGMAPPGMQQQQPPQHGLGWRSHRTAAAAFVWHGIATRLAGAGRMGRRRGRWVCSCGRPHVPPPPPPMPPGDMMRGGGAADAIPWTGLGVSG